MIMQISYIINEISRKWYTEGLEGEEKAMEKENGGFFNPTIKKFWNCLYQEAVDLKQCEKYIVDAIALVSDEFGLIKVEMELTIPPNRYQLHGEQRSVMLAAKEGFGESTDFSFAFTTGGNVVFHVVWDEEQTDYGRDELEILLRDVFFWYETEFSGADPKYRYGDRGCQSICIYRLCRDADGTRHTGTILCGIF